MSIVGSYFSSYFNYIYGGFVKMSNSTDDGKKGNNENTDDTKKGNNENTDDTKKGNNTKKIIAAIITISGCISVAIFLIRRA